QVITNRGVKIWPNGQPETFCTDHWRCRFLFDEETKHSRPWVEYSDVIFVISQMTTLGLEVIKTENLYLFDGVKGYSEAQGS
ncbi:hypothetical protein ACI4BE_27385, partial [Klebsiella pneumoniae]|uniref:hypothetical protein n=1 Tax=Klebsiella pneumoniae TaxID=573 RepID=UPI00385287EF